MHVCVLNLGRFLTRMRTHSLTQCPHCDGELDTGSGRGMLRNMEQRHEQGYGNCGMGAARVPGVVIHARTRPRTCV